MAAAKKTIPLEIRLSDKLKESYGKVMVEVVRKKDNGNEEIVVEFDVAWAKKTPTYVLGGMAEQRMGYLIKKIASTSENSEEPS